MTTANVSAANMSAANMTDAIAKQPVILCPGFHPAALTEQFVQSVFTPLAADAIAFYPKVVEAFCADPIAVFNWMTQALGRPSQNEQPVRAIGFSGGVVGIAGALLLWQQQGGKVEQLIAIDGWAVPIVGLPVCRLSHDSFTHWSTLPLGAGRVNFYADPSVDHLKMWGNPNLAVGQIRTGWQTQNGQQATATEFIRQVLESSVRTA